MHTHICAHEEKCSDFKDLKTRHSDFLPGFKSPKQHKNLRINQMTAEENLKMLEIRDSKGNVDTLIFKPTLLVVYSAQCRGKKFNKLKLRLPGRTKIKCCLWHIAWCVCEHHTRPVTLRQAGSAHSHSSKQLLSASGWGRPRGPWGKLQVTGGGSTNWQLCSQQHEWQGLEK